MILAWHGVTAKLHIYSSMCNTYKKHGNILSVTSDSLCKPGRGASSLLRQVGESVRRVPNFTCIATDLQHRGLIEFHVTDRSSYSDINAELHFILTSTYYPGNI